MKNLICSEQRKDNVGGLHESTPYWLNGAVPLALQLQDKEAWISLQPFLRMHATISGQSVREEMHLVVRLSCRR